LNDRDSEEVSIFCLFKNLNFQLISHVKGSVRVGYLVIVQVLHHYQADSLPVLLEGDEDIVLFVQLYNNSILMPRLDLCRLLRWLSQFLTEIKKFLLEVHI
jgi:hypothetical protein